MTSSRSTASPFMKHLQMSTTSSSTENGDENNDLKANLEKWQKMYDENAPSAKKASSSSYASSQMIRGDDDNDYNTNSNTADQEFITQKASKSEVRVVTFDLDNTIWKTGNVISSANDALAKHLEEMEIHAPIRVEKIMGTLFKNDKGKYSPLLVQEAMEEHVENQRKLKTNDVQAEAFLSDNQVEEDYYNNEPSLDHIKAPVLLTQLRIDALFEVFNNQTNANNLSSTQIQQKAIDAFDIWTKARHDAIPHNLAQSGVIKCLQEIKNIQTSYGKKIVVGAITDGNSDPRNVDMLKEYFDFCINAESVGISKPDRRVYDAAMVYVYSDPDLQHVFHDYDVDFDSSIDENGIDCNILFEKMQDQWIHIGDDFMKDIVGAKDLKMRSIWSRELVRGKEQPIQTKLATNNDGNEKEASNLTKDLNDKKVVKMIIGTEDFLMNSIQAEFADAIVDEFSEVSRVLKEWHVEGISASSTTNSQGNEDKQSSIETVNAETAQSEAADSPSTDIKDYVETLIPNNDVAQAAVTDISKIRLDIAKEKIVKRMNSIVVNGPRKIGYLADMMIEEFEDLFETLLPNDVSVRETYLSSMRMDIAQKLAMKKITNRIVEVREGRRNIKDVASTIMEELQELFEVLLSDESTRETYLSVLRMEVAQKLAKECVARRINELKNGVDDIDRVGDTMMEEGKEILEIIINDESMLATYLASLRMDVEKEMKLAELARKMKGVEVNIPKELQDIFQIVAPDEEERKGT